MDARKAAVLATLNRYFRDLSNTTPPLTVARDMIIGDAKRVIQPGSGMPLSFYTMNQTLDILEDRIRQTPGIAENYVDPEPEVWVHDDLAFIFTGSEQSVNGVGQRRGVHVFSMLNDPEVGDEEGWKIAGVTTIARSMDCRLPPIIRDVDSEVAMAAVEPVYRMLGALGKQDWESFAKTFHPDMGATLSRGAWPPSTAGMDLLMDKMKSLIATFPVGAAFAAETHDAELRICGDLAVVWAPVVILGDETVRGQGAIVFRSIKLSGDWKIVGYADTIRLT